MGKPLAKDQGIQRQYFGLVKSVSSSVNINICVSYENTKIIPLKSYSISIPIIVNITMPIQSNAMTGFPRPVFCL